jgi:ABC-type glycerol-3-phosphate transport system permease component
MALALTATRDDNAARHRHHRGQIESAWASVSAAAVIGALPSVVFALLVQRHLVRGRPVQR